ncbi:MAG: chromosomal replication initiator protein DnaA [Planctomycetes bacterium]|nr:chromosomal replication initiator protein DnaA [Planctomycetota bacterium]
MHPDQDPSLAGDGLVLPNASSDADAIHELASSSTEARHGQRDEALARAWDEVLEELRKLLNRQQMETWFRTALLRSAGPEGVVVVVQNTFTSNWLRAAPYITALETAVRNVFRSPWPVQIVVDAELTVRARAPATALAATAVVASTSSATGGAASASARPATPPASSTSASTSGRAAPRESRAPSEAGLLWSSDVALNPHYRFDNFVVGPCNRFAHAAAVGVSESPGRSYNPFFLHGSVGLGKTHLLQSLCYSLLERNPDTRILYLSCETFINHFISALENGDLQKFRNKYRNVDVLVVDDIHLLANKERTQEEFFHTFNTLYNASKQIVLSSDSPPKEIPTLQDRLVSRFKWGLVTEIEKPCYETRMAILKRKSRERGKELPDSVAQLVAEHVDSNIRELEGAVNRLLGYASLNGLDVTPDLARHVLRDVFLSPKGQPSMDDILRLVTSHFQIKVTELQSRRRTKAIAHPRQIAMFLARSITRHSLEQIGGFFGGRDHTTVLYAVEQIEKQMKADDRFRALIQGLLGQLQR